jgi:hypothetical protein
LTTCSFYTIYNYHNGGSKVEEEKSLIISIKLEGEYPRKLSRLIELTNENAPSGLRASRHSLTKSMIEAAIDTALEAAK